MCVLALGVRRTPDLQLRGMPRTKAQACPTRCPPTQRRRASAALNTQMAEDFVCDPQRADSTFALGGVARAMALLKPRKEAGRDGLVSETLQAASRQLLWDDTSALSRKILKAPDDASATIPAWDCMEARPLGKVLQPKDFKSCRPRAILLASAKLWPKTRLLCLERNDVTRLHHLEHRPRREQQM